MIIHQAIADLAAAIAAAAIGILFLRFLVAEVAGHLIVTLIRNRHRRR